MFGEWNDYDRLLEDEKDTLESVRATYHFLSDASDEPIGFMGTEQNRLEMLFFSPAERGKGIGKQLVQYRIL